MKSIKIEDKIYEKQFQINTYGYACQEVDTFFDEVNEDIGKLEREIADLKREITKLRNEKEALEGEKRQLLIAKTKLEANNHVESSSTVDYSNLQFIERLSSLENLVMKICDKFDIK